MTRRKQSSRSGRTGKQRRREIQRQRNKTIFAAVLDWFIPKGQLFTKDRFHGNIKWTPEQLTQQAMIWALLDNKYVTDAFEVTQEICDDLKIKKAAKSTLPCSTRLLGIEKRLALGWGNSFEHWRRRQRAGSGETATGC